MSDNMPDFDSMSPEEIMAWMETLAKRQGASEGFTTEADMDIAEIDPDTVVIDEPGYVPFGQEAPTQVAFPAAPTPPPEPVRPVSPPPVSQPPRQPEPPRPLEPVRPAATFPRPSEPIPSPEPVRPAASLPRQPEPVAPPAPSGRQQDDFDTLMPSSAEEGSLAWLESLAADQGDSLFNLDLSSLGEVQPVEASPTPVDPVTWLEDLARTQGELPSTPPSPVRPTEVDSLEWLETLARRQGAKPEELMTPANLNVSAPPADVEEPAYTPFSFDTPTTHRTAPEPLRLEDPTAFLDTLASEQGYSEAGVRATQPPPPAPAPEEPEEADMSLEGIQQAINEGTVTPEQMQVFLEHETDVAAQQPEEALLEDYDADAPPIPAELPDWLLEQVGPPPSQPEPPMPAADQPPLDEVIAQPVPVDEMPDWLRADITSSADVDLESIFAQTEDQPLTITPEPAAEAEPQPEIALEIDPNDPWVEAFDLEYVQGQPNIDTVPEWYEQNVNDPQRLAAIEQQDQEQPEQEEPITEIAMPAAVQATSDGLSDEPLPEEADLPLGVSQTLPSWFAMPAARALETVEITEAVAEALEVDLGAEEEESLEEPLVAEIPDWLREVGSIVQAEEIPDWLKETLTTEEEAAPLAFEIVEHEPVAEVVTPAPAPVMPQPAPAPRAAAVGTGSLEVARAKQENGDLDASLAEYEVLVRSNAELDAVVEDLTRLVKSYRSNPVVYRVLGDGLMRQGKLQAALDTYREALNQL